MQSQDDFIVRLCGGCGELSGECICRWTTIVRRKLPMLTRRQYTVLSLVIDGQLAGRTPSYEEIRIALGLVNRNGVLCHLIALARKGYISKPPEKRSRAITVLVIPEAADIYDPLTIKENTR